MSERCFARDKRMSGIIHNFLSYPFIALRVVLSKFDVHSVLHVRIQIRTDERRS